MGDAGTLQVMATYNVTFSDERGQQTFEADDVIVDEGIYEFWKANAVFLRTPADQVTSIDPPATADKPAT